MQNTAVRVVILDENAKDRAEMRRHLALDNVVVAGEAGLGTEALTLSAEQSADIAFVRLEEPVARSLQTIEALTLTRPDLMVVAISSLRGQTYLRRAMLAGAKEFLTRPVAKADIEAVTSAAVELRAKRKRLEHQMATGPRFLGTIITVFSPKGGVGKSVISTNLAVSLSKISRRQVALVDLDLQMGDVAMMMGILPAKDIADAVQQADRLDIELIQSFLTPHTSGVKVLPAPRRPEQAEKIPAFQIRRILELLASKFDYVIIDTSSLLNDVILMSLDLSTFVLLVAAKELPCLRRVEQTLRLMESWGYSDDKLKLVVNRSDSDTGVNFDEIEKALNAQIFWDIPSDFATVVSSMWGCPFTQTKPKSKIAISVDELAYKLSGIEKSRTGLWGKLFSGAELDKWDRSTGNVQAEANAG